MSRTFTPSQQGMIDHAQGDVQAALATLGSVSASLGNPDKLATPLECDRRADEIQSAIDALIGARRAMTWLSANEEAFDRINFRAGTIELDDLDGE